MPGMQSPPHARRKEEGRSQVLQVPEMRAALFGRFEHVAFLIEADAFEDKGDIDADNARLPLLGDRRDRRRKPKNGPVLVRQMPGCGDGMVDGIEAFRARLDRRDEVRPDQGLGVGRRRLDDLRREDRQGRLPGSGLRLQPARVLPPIFREARIPDEGDGHRLPFRKDRAEVAAHTRRGGFPQRHSEGAVTEGRLGQVRRRRRGIREEDEADEQLLLVPEALLRIP